MIKFIAGGALFGAGAGLLTVFVVPVQWEIAVWIALILVLAASAAFTDSKHPFRNGALTALATGICITATHLLFIESYLAAHPEEAQALAEFADVRPEWTLLALAPLYWFVLILLTGVTTILIARLQKGTGAA